MTAALIHPFTAEELTAGRALAESFLARIASGESIEADGLCQAIELARHGSLTRMRGFAAKLQEVLREAGHATD